MEKQQHNSSGGQGQYTVPGPVINSASKIGLDNSAAVPVNGGRRSRRSRYRFQEGQNLVSMDPAGSNGVPNPISVVQLAPIQSAASVVMATPLRARQLVQADLLQHADMASVAFEGVRSEAPAPLAHGSVEALANGPGVIEPSVQQGPVNKAGLEADSAATLWPFASDLSEVAIEGDLSVSEKPELEDDPFCDSIIAIRESARTRSLRTWQSIKQLFFGRRFSQSMVAIMLVIFASTLDVPWRAWFSDHVEQARDRIEVAINSVTQPIRERAAFFIVDDFEQGADAWLSEGSMTFDPGGLLRVSGLALREDTLNLASYRLDFDAKIEKGAVGWVVRAQDMKNYYAFKLVEPSAGLIPCLNCSATRSLMAWKPPKQPRWRSLSRVTCPTRTTSTAFLSGFVNPR